MLAALAWQNRSSRPSGALQGLYVLSAGLLLITAATVASEYLSRWDMHRSLFYAVAAGVFPLILVSSARAGRGRWSATMIALVYMGVTIAMIVILPLFRGEPLLGPIYIHTDRFMPPDFPLLVMLPAALIDVAMQRTGRGKDWRLSAFIAVLVLVAFLAVQWPFADFLMSPRARNWFFAADRMPYVVSPDFQQRWFVLNPPDRLTTGLLIALVVAFVSTRCGLWWGNWMAGVRR